MPISIHASRMGCDFPVRPLPSSTYHFNPRIPYGMRQDNPRYKHCYYLFQSTHPVWDATGFIVGVRDQIDYFNPRIPYGMRPGLFDRLSMSTNFNPRIPYGMRPGSPKAGQANSNFNPRIPYGMRRPFGLRLSRIFDFNPRIPYGMRPETRPTMRT